MGRSFKMCEDNEKCSTLETLKGGPLRRSRHRCENNNNSNMALQKQRCEL
jgi:ssDNA-binding Zn-finger/Zn-ribbon topoisomerase 1